MSAIPSFLPTLPFIQSFTHSHFQGPVWAAAVTEGAWRAFGPMERAVLVATHSNLLQKAFRTKLEAVTKRYWTGPPHSG